MYNIWNRDVDGDITIWRWTSGRRQVTLIPESFF